MHFGKMRRKERVRHCSHCFFWVAAILCLREEGPRAVTALYFGWPAFRNRHFVIWGGGGALYPSLTSVPEVSGWSVFFGGAFRTALALLMPLGECC